MSTREFEALEEGKKKYIIGIFIIGGFLIVMAATVGFILNFVLPKAKYVFIFFHPLDEKK